MPQAALATENEDPIPYHAEDTVADVASQGGIIKGDVREVERLCP